MLKALHVISGDLWAGAEVQAYTLIRGLKEIPGTDIAAVLLNEGELASRLRAIAVTVFVTDERELGSMRILARLRTILRAWQPDVLHTHRQKENILGALANRSGINVPSVRTVHGAPEHSRITGWKSIHRGIIRGLDAWCGRVLQGKIIAVSQDLGIRLAAEYPPEMILVVENGVDAVELQSKSGVAEFRLAAPQCIHVGIAGRLVEIKRIDLFLDAAAWLVRNLPQKDFQFHVFGDGPLRTHLEDRAERMGLTGRVIFYGHRSDVATCISSLDALVICSDHEGMPMVALEAAALGVPTVAHAVGGLPDVVPDEFLVTQHTGAAYAAGVLRTLRDDSPRIVRRSAEEVVKNYSARVNAERIRAVYEQLVTDRRAMRQPIEV